jgi:pyrroline-5-carboxylate reductase
MLRLVTSTVTRKSSFMLRNARTLFSSQAVFSSQAEALATTTTDAKVGGFHKIACIGAGMMAQAVINPLVKTGLQPPEKVSVFDVSIGAMENLQKNLGVNISDNIGDCMDGADLVICCVKPQNLTEGFFNECLKANLRDDAIFLSVIAGKTIDTFRKGGFERIVRSMPNTPASIGQGMTVWSCTDNLTTSERKKIKNILSSFGKSVRISVKLISRLTSTLSRRLFTACTNRIYSLSLLSDVCGR